MSQNLTGPVRHCRTQPKQAFFTGSGALLQGQAVCYDRTVGTATEADGRRATNVALPSNSNNLSFAGVTSRAYDARTGGQMIEILEPGSECLIQIDGAVTLSEREIVTFIVGTASDAGKFDADQDPIIGRGCARILQTVSGAGLVLAELIGDAGFESGGAETIETATLTAGGAVTLSQSGLTVFEGPSTPASDVTYTLADGTYVGQRKRFSLEGALTTNDVLITVTNGIQLDGTTALASLELDGDGDDTTLEWSGNAWRVIHNSGTAQA